MEKPVVFNTAYSYSSERQLILGVLRPTNDYQPGARIKGPIQACQSGLTLYHVDQQLELLRPLRFPKKYFDEITGAASWIIY